MKWAQASNARGKKKQKVTFNEPSKNAGKFIFLKLSIKDVVGDWIWDSQSKSGEGKRKKICIVGMKRHHSVHGQSKKNHPKLAEPSFEKQAIKFCS